MARGLRSLIHHPVRASGVHRGNGEAGDYLSLPVYHHWNGESNGAVPSHVEGSMGDSQINMVVDVNSPSGWTDSIYKVGSDTYFLMDLGKEIDPGIAGIRVCVLAKTYSTTNSRCHMVLQENPTIFSNNSGNMLMALVAESSNPDGFYTRRFFNDVADFDELVDFSSAYTTGNAWTYYRWEQLASGNSTWEAYTDAGVLVYSKSYAYQGTQNKFPTGMRYLGALSSSTSTTAYAQAWVGASADAWPSLPMSPITNL